MTRVFVPVISASISRISSVVEYRILKSARLHGYARSELGHLDEVRARPLCTAILKAPDNHFMLGFYSRAVSNHLSSLFSDFY